MRLIDQICKLVVEERPITVDAKTIQQIKRCILNHLGLVLAGATNPSVRAMAAVATDQGRYLSSDSEAHILAGITPFDLAAIYAAAANVYDYDETHISTVMHATSVVIPAVIGQSMRQPMDGNTFLKAVLVGIQVALYVGKQVSPHHYDNGWHITSTCGIFGAAAAVSYVLGADESGVKRAMAHAFVLSSGSVEALGTGSKSLGVGNAAANGLRAALFAQANVNGPEDPFEGKFGFINLYGQGKRTKLNDSDTQRWLINDVLLKPYPCGIVLNPVVEAALNLRSRLLESGRNFEDIQNLLLHGNPLLRMRTDRPVVDTIEMRQVSSQYVLPTALIDGCLGLAQMRSTEPVAEIKNYLGQIISFKDAADKTLEAVELTALFSDGEKISISIEQAVGGSARPLSNQALEEKVNELCRFAGCEKIASWLISEVNNLDECPNINQIIYKLNLCVFEVNKNNSGGEQL